MKNIHGLIGTYADKGIYEFVFDYEQGEFSHHDLYIQVKESKYLSYEKGSLAFLCNVQHPGIMQSTTSLLYSSAKEAHVACYITQDDHYIYTANFHDGTLVRYHKEPYAITLDQIVTIQNKAGSHQVLLTQDEVLVPNCLLDTITLYHRATLDFQESIDFPKGSGPRHGVLTQDEQMLYLVSEFSCEIFCIALQDHKHIIKRLTLLQEKEHGAAAAIRMSKDEKYLYITIREINKLYVVDIKLWKVMQSLDCGGEHPRDMNLSPDDDYVFCVNKDSNDMTVFQRNEEDGLLVFRDRLSNIPQGVSIVFTKGDSQHAKE